MADERHKVNSHTNMLDRDASDGVEVALSSRAEVDEDRNGREVAALSHHLLWQKFDNG